MKSQITPCTHVGVTNTELTIEFGASGSTLKHTVTVPAGTKVRKLDSGSDPWVVEDLSFIESKTSILYHDADHYGIRIPFSNVVNVREV